MILMKYQWGVQAPILKIHDCRTGVLKKNRKEKQRNPKPKEYIVEVFVKECELKIKKKLF